MRNSLKLGFVLALGATAIFAGCSSGSDAPTGGAGAPGAGAPSAGAPGAPSAGAPSAGAPSAGAPNGGTGGSSGGASAGAAGTAGSSGAAGTSGTAGTSGAAGSGGAGGTSGAGAGGAGAGGAGAGAGGAGAGAGGTGGGGAGAGGAGGAPPTCAAESVGLPAAGGAGSVGTAVVLIDNVVVKKAGATVIQWQFADNTTIVDEATGDTPTAGKWARSNYGYTVSKLATASDTFIDCAGNPAAGALKNIVPFSAVGDQYEIRVPIAQTDYSGATITANIKLVGGGVNTASCPVKAWIYAINNVGGTNTDANNTIPLEVGKWSAATLTVPATGFDKVGIVAVRLTTFACQ